MAEYFGAEDSVVIVSEVEFVVEVVFEVVFEIVMAVCILQLQLGSL